MQESEKNEPKQYDEDWRKAIQVVPANFRGLLAFRHFSLKPAEFTHFTDTLVLGSIANQSNWQLHNNIAICFDHDHPEGEIIPFKECVCGFYGSYSSSIIYHPNYLHNRNYCFAAVRMHGNCVLAQNGLRGAKANVVGILFSPISRDTERVQRLQRHLDQAKVFYTFSALEFIRQFPDESYTSLLKFDPIERLAQLEHEQCESIPPTTRPNDWYEQNVDSYEKAYCRPMRAELMQRIEVGREPELKKFAISLKPQYRPGGELYRHPLLEAWGE